MKNYCIKLGTMYLQNIKLSIEFSFNEMIESISFTKNKYDLYFTDKENGEELCKKIYIVSGIKAELVNVNELEELKGVTFDDYETEDN